LIIFLAKLNSKENLFANNISKPDSVEEVFQLTIFNKSQIQKKKGFFPLINGEQLIVVTGVDLMWKQKKANKSSLNLDRNKVENTNLFQVH